MKDVKQNNDKSRKRQPTIEVVDLFCGIGGLNYGMKTAGFNILAGYDLDWTCQYAYETNTGGEFFYKDVKEVTGDDTVKQVFVTTHSKETLYHLNEMLEDYTDYQDALWLYTIENTSKDGHQAYKYTYEGLAEACNNDIEIRSVVL